MASTEFHALWDELRPIMEVFHGRTEIADFRSDWEKMFAVLDGALPARCEPVDANGVPARWICHASSEHSEYAILYLHGGGFAVGSIDSHSDLMARLSRAAGARVLGLDYRLAPEHPFPAANDDTEAAWNWLLAQGYDAGSIAIAGDSAGGGLTLTTALRLRALGLPAPSSLTMFSPWVDLTLSGESMSTRAAVDRMVTPEILGTMASIYLQQQPAESEDLRITALGADFSNLPPMLVQVGDDEVLYSDAERIVARAHDAGVAAELASFVDMCHVFQIFAHRVPEAERAIDQAGRFIKQNLG